MRIDASVLMHDNSFTFSSEAGLTTTVKVDKSIPHTPRGLVDMVLQTLLVQPPPKKWSRY